MAAFMGNPDCLRTLTRPAWAKPLPAIRTLSMSDRETETMRLEPSMTTKNGSSHKP